ncbi:MAG: hypothetical protein FJX74_11910 [Armatimonadetes bacterium]|nr:hypothetical protein [Armatimonadota bacterium]
MTGHNPFEGLSPASLAPIYEWPGEALRFVEGEFDCLHVVGDCGMGKTTLLRQLELRAAEAGGCSVYGCVPVGGGLELELPAAASLALIDETDRLSGEGLIRLLGRVREARCRCVLAGHRRQLRAIRQARLTVAYLRLRPLPGPALQTLFESRIALAYGPDAPGLTIDAARALLRASRGNIERCLQIGYEVFEDLDGLREVTAADVGMAAASLDRALATGGASR